MSRISAIENTCSAKSLEAKSNTALDCISSTDSDPSPPGVPAKR